MDKQDAQNEKKALNRAKSYNSTTTSPLKAKTEPAKRKSFNENEAVRTLDLALGRLKKSKFVSGEYSSIPGSPLSRGSRAPSDLLCMDSASPMTPTNIYSGINVNDSSLMSMNFSHYELMRNLSRSNSTSEGAFSGTTNSNTFPNVSEATVRNERLEKYFRSAEVWSRKARDRDAGHNVHFEIPEK